MAASLAVPAFLSKPRVHTGCGDQKSALGAATTADAERMHSGCRADAVRMQCGCRVAGVLRWRRGKRSEPGRVRGVSNKTAREVRGRHRHLPQVQHATSSAARGATRVHSLECNESSSIRSATRVHSLKCNESSLKFATARSSQSQQRPTVDSRSRQQPTAADSRKPPPSVPRK